MGLIPDFLSCGRYFMLGEAYFMSGTECNWHCRWKALHSDKCLLLLMNKARICELWGCFEGIACSEMCDFVLCSSFFPFIGFSCWSLPFPAVHEPCNLPWSHPGLRSSLECCRGRQPQPKVLSRSLAPSSLFQAQGTWDIALGSRQSSLCVRQGRWEDTGKALPALLQYPVPPVTCQPGKEPCCLSYAPRLLVLPAPGLPFFPQPGFIGLDCAPIIYWCIFMKNWSELLSHSCIFTARGVVFS